MISTPVMISSGHTHGHVTNSEKDVKVDFNIFILIFIIPHVCMDLFHF